PWRRCRSQTRSVSKCSPSAVLTSSPDRNSSIPYRGMGGRGGGSANSEPSLMFATWRRRAASCCWTSSMLRFFFAHYSARREHESARHDPLRPNDEPARGGTDE